MLNLMGNGGPVTWLLLICGLFAALVFFERLFNLHRAQIAADDFLKGVYNILNRDNPVEAAAICEEAPGPVARLALAAVLHHDDTLENIGRAIEDAGLEEIPRMERGLGWLATLARITPLIGLLGTVLGMIKTFQAASMTGLGNPQMLAEGISEALYNTAGGLMVAIPCIMANNHFRSRVERLIHWTEGCAGEIVRRAHS